MADMKRLYGSFEIKSATENEEFFYFEGYGSTFGNTDLVFDVIEKGAFANSIAKFNPKLLWSHNPAELPIGTIDEIYEDEKGLFIKARLSKKVSKSNDIGELLKMKALDSMSIGFVIKDYEIKDKITYIKSAELHEISIVVFPANPSATVTNIKLDQDATKSFSVEMVEHIKDKRDFEKFLRDVGFSRKAALLLASRFKEDAQSESVDVDKKTDSEINSIDQLSELNNLIKQL